MVGRYDGTGRESDKTMKDVAGVKQRHGDDGKNRKRYCDYIATVLQLQRNFDVGDHITTMMVGLEIER